jgi:opacity protein-like surface antigen
LKRLVLAATLSVALATGATVAQADQPTHPPHPPKANTHSKRCGIVKRAFIVSGDHATFAGTKNADGTYTGDLTLSPNRANRAARKSGVDTKNHTPITLHLENTKVKFTGGATDLSSLQPTDKVKVIGKIPYAKKGGHGKNACPDAGFGSDRYDSDHITVRKVTVHRPS